MFFNVKRCGTNRNRLLTLKGDITAFFGAGSLQWERGRGLEFRPKHLVLYKRRFNISNCSVVLNPLLCVTSDVLFQQFPSRSSELPR